MELKTLRNFVAVVQEGGVTAAAESIRMSQPALSRRIQELEGELGATLFVRGNRRHALELTSEGRMLYRRAQEIIELADRAVTEIRSNGQIEGDVHVAAAQSSVMRLVARAAMRVRQRHPGVLVHLHDDYGPNIVERLSNGLADFGVLVQPVDMGRFDHLPLPGGDPMGLLMRADHPLAQRPHIVPEDLKGLPLIVPKGALMRGDLSGWLGRRAGKLNVVGTMNLSYNASRFVEEGYGCAVSLEGLVDASDSSDLRFRPFEPMITSSLALAWKKDQPLSPAAAALLEAVREVLAE